MSKIKVTPFFKFCRVKVMKQEVYIARNVVAITVKPDERYIPICHKCQRKVKQIHSYQSRRIRDLNVFDAKSFISIAYRKLLACDIFSHKPYRISMFFGQSYPVDL